MRHFVAALGAAAGTGLLIACTLTQSLDYLQNGGGGTDMPDVVSEQTVMPDGGTDAAPKPPEVLVPNQTKPGLLAQDSASLFWISNGVLMSVAKTGGTPKMHGSFVAPRYIAVDPDPQGAIFVASTTNVFSVPKAGGDGGIVFAGAAGSPEVEVVKADETSLYVLQYDIDTELSEIRRMAKDGTARVDVDVDGGAESLMTIDSQTILWMDSSLSPTTFYEISKTAPAGTPPKTFPLLVDEEYPELEFTVDATNLYWTTTDATTTGAVIISRKREVGAAPVTLFRGGPNDTFGPLALDANDVYVIEYKSGSVLRVPKGGAMNGTAVVAGLQGPTSLVVDATHVYVSVEGTGNTGSIVKQPK